MQAAVAFESIPLTPQARPPIASQFIPRSAGCRAETARMARTDVAHNVPLLTHDRAPSLALFAGLQVEG
jgi:hypothetical protein